MTVFFHGNFGLNRQRMAGLLEKSLANPALGDADLAKPFGYGAPFAAIYRSWLHKTGLTRRRRPISLTDFGEVIVSKDKSLSERATLEFMHHSLTEDPERAEAWHFFFQNFRNSHKVFSTKELRHELMVQLSPHSEKHFGAGSTMIPIIARKLLECYASSEALGPLNLLRNLGSDKFEFTDVSIPAKSPNPAALAKRFS